MKTKRQLDALRRTRGLDSIARDLLSGAQRQYINEIAATYTVKATRIAWQGE